MAQPDTTKYRSSGPWGAGSGANLTAGEIDGNFWGIIQRLVFIEDNPLDAISIAEFTIARNKLTIHMTDGTTRGPFVLPSAVYRFTGTWEPDTAYAFMDVFVVDDGTNNAGLYWVIGTDGYHSPA